MDGARTENVDYQKLTIEGFLDGVKALSPSKQYFSKVRIFPETIRLKGRIG